MRHSMSVEMMKLADLVAADYNPRKKLLPGDSEYAKLKDSILSFGCVEPVIWNKATGHVVGGHQRIQVMRDLGYEECEVSIVDLPLHREKKLNLALNKISGQWDNDKLKDVLTDLFQDTEDTDFSETGFDQTEVDSFLKDIDIDEFFNDSEYVVDKSSSTHHEKKMHVCPKCGAEFEL